MISIPVRPQYHNPNRSKNPSTWSKRESTGFPLTVIPCPLLNRWYAKPVIPIDQSHNEIYLRRVDIPCNSIEYPGLKNKHACMYTHTLLLCGIYIYILRAENSNWIISEAIAHSAVSTKRKIRFLAGEKRKRTFRQYRAKRAPSGN